MELPICLQPWTFLRAAAYSSLFWMFSDRGLRDKTAAHEMLLGASALLAAMGRKILPLLFIIRCACPFLWDFLVTAYISNRNARRRHFRNPLFCSSWVKGGTNHRHRWVAEAVCSAFDGAHTIFKILLNSEITGNYFCNAKKTAWLKEPQGQPTKNLMHFSVNLAALAFGMYTTLESIVKVL